MKRITFITGALIAFMVLPITINAQRRSGSSSSESSGGSYRSSSDNSNRSSNSSSGNYRSSSNNDSRSSSGSYRSSSNDNRTNNSSYRAASGSYNNRPNEIKVRERRMKSYPNNRAVYVAHRTDRFGGPSGYVPIRHHGIDYGYRAGRYYVYRNGGYVVTVPPRGIHISVIPDGFFTINVGSVPYYYYGGAYYRRDVSLNSYEVVDPPMGAIVPELPSEDVNTVVINGRTYLEYDGILYKTVVTRYGIQYKVMGRINDADSIYY